MIVKPIHGQRTRLSILVGALSVKKTFGIRMLKKIVLASSLRKAFNDRMFKGLFAKKTSVVTEKVHKHIDDQD